MSRLIPFIGVFIVVSIYSVFLFADPLPDFQSARQAKTGYPVGYPDHESLKKEPISSLEAQFRTPPRGYGEVPFHWFTGDKLTKERLAWQLDFLSGKTLPGVKTNDLPRDYPLPRIEGIQVNAAHAKGSLDGKTYGLFGNSYPLDPPLFSPEFWELWSWLAGECDSRGLGVGISDYTLAWPGQGFIVDEVISDPGRQGKQLKMKKNRIPVDSKTNEKSEANEIARARYPVEEDAKQVDEYVFYWEHNPKSIDPMDVEAGEQIADRFFGETERRVPERYRKALNYYFQDELHLGIDGLIWTPRFAVEFEKRKGYDIRRELAHLFQWIDDKTPKIRLDYHDVKVSLTEEGYFQPVCRWHNERGLLYGCDQMSRGLNPMEYGDYFRTIRWFSAPGHDTPGSGADIIKGKVSSSVSHLYGAPRVWLEGYHSAGWGMTLENLTRTTNENYAVGCNLLCLHGLYYTTHGGFWEWAPPCYHFRMPYWRHTGVWLQYFERLSFLLSQGVHVADVAIVYPVEQGAAGYDVGHSTRLAFDLGRNIYRNGIDFDFIDGQSVARSTVENGSMNVAGESFRVLILPAMKALRWDAVEKIREFHQAGGVVIALECVPEASDRIGANDPELERIMKEVFEDGNGILLSNEKSEQPEFGPRRYEDGSEGRWVWSDKTAQDVAFKAVWKQGKKRTKIRFHVDNRGELYLNGKQLCSKVDYEKGWTGEVGLADGDVIVARCHDDDKPGGRTAGFFFAAVVDGKTVLSSDDFLCSIRREDRDGEAWRRSASTDKLEKVSQRFVHEFHVTGIRGQALSGGKPVDFAARVEKIVSEKIVRDFKVDGGAWVLHRRIETADGHAEVYFVQHAAKNAWATFRASGEVRFWDAWNGTASKIVETEKLDGDRTRVRLPLNEEEGRLIVFLPKNAKSDDIPVYRRYVEDDSPKEIEGLWESEPVSTMDNTFGDFRLPVEKNPFDGSYMLGPEARRFKVFRAKSDPANERFAAPDFDDSKWWTSTCSFGPQLVMYNTETAKSPEELARIESELFAGFRPEPLDLFSRRIYEFSWRWGVEGDPGDQRGYHGLKEIVSDDFLVVPKGTTYFHGSVFLDENSTVCIEKADGTQSGTVVPQAVWVDGKKVDSQIELAAGSHTVLIRYDKPGRSHVVFSTACEAEAERRTPLSMKWFDRKSVLRYRPEGLLDFEEQWFRFVSPPGLAEIALKPTGRGTVFVNGKKIADWTKNDETISRFEIPETARRSEPSVVAIRVADVPPGMLDGAVFDDPVFLRCEKGTIRPGDWSKQGVLETFSGGMWYRKAISIDATELESLKERNGRFVLDLGRVSASCEVRVNGSLAAVLTTSPWRCDITKQLKSGDNRIEILVMSTMSNHYQTIPSQYRGKPEAGLIGPVRLCKEEVEKTD